MYIYLVETVVFHTHSNKTFLTERALFFSASLFYNNLKFTHVKYKHFEHYDSFFSSPHLIFFTNNHLLT